MEPIEITKQEFEAAIHAAAICDDTIFDAVKPYIDRSMREVERILLTTGADAIAGNSTLGSAVKNYLCEVGFLKAIRHLDLVLTDAGFGVVHNDHIAPASAERVNNLEEALLLAADRSRCDIIRILITIDGWGREKKATHIVNVLLWDIVEAVDMCGVEKLTHAAWVKLQKDIFDAEFKLALVLGYEVLTELLLATVQNTISDIQGLAIQIVKTAVANLIANNGNEQMQRNVKSRVIQWFDKHKDDFSSYTASSEYRARQEKPYENRKDSPAYFFG